MPIEIKELHVRVSVTAPAAGDRPAGAPDPVADAGGRQSLVAECVEQVLQVLRDQRER
jgi:hypothetical protein